MQVAVVGGNLQGVEAAYLAKKAGWEVTLIDRRDAVPARGLCDHFQRADVAILKNLHRIFEGFDWVVPALENLEALTRLNQWHHHTGIPFLFDLTAYKLSSSKIESDKLFSRISVPSPLPYPDCGFPVVVKPSFGSGSQGVRIIHDPQGLKPFLERLPEENVIQAYLNGPSYSIEILGMTGKYQPLQVTDLQMDAEYDCKRVLAPTDLPAGLVSDFETIAQKLAQEMKLTGLMDVEVILDKDVLRVLEIDARLPSQTPTAVFWSTGVNMLEMLVDLFLNSTGARKYKPRSNKGVVYEHIRIKADTLTVHGEHVMSHTAPLRLRKDFFGADEALTNYSRGRDEWVATLIICDEDRKAAWEKRNAVISDIMQQFKLEMYRETWPEET